MYHNDSMEALKQFGMDDEAADAMFDRLDRKEFTFEQAVFALDLHDTMMDMMEGIYRDIRSEQKRVLNESSTLWAAKAQKMFEHFGRAISGWAEGHNTPITVTTNGFVLRFYEDQYARGCHVGSDADTFTISREFFAALQADRAQAISEFVQKQVTQIDDAVAADEQAAKEQRQRDEEAQTVRDRAEYERLSKKFGTFARDWMGGDAGSNG